MRGFRFSLKHLTIFVLFVGLMMWLAISLQSRARQGRYLAIHYTELVAQHLHLEMKHQLDANDFGSAIHDLDTAIAELEQAPGPRTREQAAEMADLESKRASLVEQADRSAALMRYHKALAIKYRDAQSKPLLSVLPDPPPP